VVDYSLIMHRGGSPSVVPPRSLHGSRRPGTHLAAFASLGIRPGIPPSSALRVDAARRRVTTATHLNDANCKGTLGGMTLDAVQHFAGGHIDRLRLRSLLQRLLNCECRLGPETGYRGNLLNRCRT
jgi:hypothetical protein